MNKKIIYLSVFLILGLFLISACSNQAKGLKTGVLFGQKEKNVNDLASNEYYLKVGGNINFSNKIVSLLNVGSSGNILVEVQGFQDVISAYGTKTINDLQITNLNAFYSNVLSNRAARIRIEQSYTAYNLTNQSYTYQGIHVGDVIKIYSMDLTLANVGSNGNVAVNVNGVEDVIDKNSVKNVNCLTIWNLGYSYSDKITDRKALLNIFYNKTAC